MIRSISLRNFKAWQTLAPTKIAPLTGLFGANSAGKSSLIQVLLLLKQTAESPDRALVLHLGDDRSLIELGTFADLAYEHNTASAVGWSLTWDLPHEFEVQDIEAPSNTLLSSRELTYSAEVSSNGGGRLVLERFGYQVSKHSFGMERDGSRYRLAVDPHDFVLKRERGRPAKVASAVKCYGFPDALTAGYRNADFLADLELEFELLCGRIYYLGPLPRLPATPLPMVWCRALDNGNARRERHRCAARFQGPRAVHIARNKEASP